MITINSNVMHYLEISLSITNDIVPQSQNIFKILHGHNLWNIIFEKKNSHKCIQIIVSTIVAVNSHMYTLWYKSVWLKWFKGHPKSISMAQCKTAVTPLLTHWSYCSLALSHPYMQQAILFETPQWGSISLTLLLSSPTIKPIKSLTHQDWHAYRSQ